MKETIKKLKKKAENCAYCGIEMTDNQKTLDHIIPKCRRGTKAVSNIAVCCESCNNIRGKIDIQSFLMQENRADYFETYLKTVDFKIDDTHYYSELIKKRITENTYVCSSQITPETIKVRNEERNKSYKLPDGKIIKITQTQAAILELFLSGKDEADYKQLAKDLKISNTEIRRQISCINNITGILPLDKFYDDGIRFNTFFEGIEKINEV